MPRSEALPGEGLPIGPRPFPTMPVRPFPLPPIRPVPVGPPTPASLPVASTQNGKIFSDRNDPNLHWYLPDLALAPDVDPSFAFAASQTGQQANGQPFNVAQLTIGVLKSTPAQVTDFGQANPTAKMTEIPLENLAAVLTSSYKDQAGQDQVRSFTASSVNDMGNGTIVLGFTGSILGDSVLALYQDLTEFGKAAVTLNAVFQAWFQPRFHPIPLPPHPLPLPPHAMLIPAHPVISQIGQGPVTSLFASSGSEALQELILPIRPPFGPPIRPPFGPPVRPPIRPPFPPQPAPALVEVALQFTVVLPIGLKYEASGYQPRYTVSTAKVPSHIILSATDLSTFNQTQTQYAELKALGDINLKYPSLSRAYVGVMSRTLVLIPQRYSIVRGAAGCAASCTARVDTSPSSMSQCAFEFSFIVAPEVNQVDLARLQEEISGNADFNDYQLTFPDFLAATPPSTLLTSFASTVQFAAGPDPHSVALTVTIVDQGASVPAVADANIFILRLTSETGTDLIGSINFKLDDGYPDPVLATLDLNFQHTTGPSDELLAQFDQNADMIVVTNPTSLDLQMQEYALVQNGNISNFPGQVRIPAGASAQVPLPANHTDLAFLSVAQLLLPAVMDPAAVSKFLNFQTVNIQDTQVFVGIDASGVDFKKVASLAIQVTFPTLPSISPWAFTLTGNLLSESTHIQIPIANALFSFPGTVNVTATWLDSTKATVAFALQNDFASTPVLVLKQSEIDSPPVSQT